jgi:hypothetical protein
VPDLNYNRNRDNRRQRRRRNPCNPPVPEPGNESNPNRSDCGWLTRRSARRFSLTSRLLRKINHLPAAATRRKMGQHLPAFPLRKNPLNKRVEAFRVGVKIELGS